ncbi:hypothetical protein Drorol1_Dr00019383, partial [Drosera rotundifolia]
MCEWPKFLESAIPFLLEPTHKEAQPNWFMLLALSKKKKKNYFGLGMLSQHLRTPPQEIQKIPFHSPSLSGSFISSPQLNSHLNPFSSSQTERVFLNPLVVSLS